MNNITFMTTCMLHTSICVMVISVSISLSLSSSDAIDADVDVDVVSSTGTMCILVGEMRVDVALCVAMSRVSLSLRDIRSRVGVRSCDADVILCDVMLCDVMLCDGDVMLLLLCVYVPCFAR